MNSVVSQEAIMVLCTSDSLVRRYTTAFQTVMLNWSTAYMSYSTLAVPIRQSASPFQTIKTLTVYLTLLAYLSRERRNNLTLLHYICYKGVVGKHFVDETM